MGYIYWELPEIPIPPQAYVNKNDGRVFHLSARLKRFLEEFGVAPEILKRLSEETNVRLSNPMQSQIRRLPQGADAPKPPRGRPRKEKSLAKRSRQRTMTSQGASRGDPRAVKIKKRSSVNAWRRKLRQKVYCRLKK